MLIEEGRGEGGREALEEELTDMTVGEGVGIECKREKDREKNNINKNILKMAMLTW